MRVRRAVASDARSIAAVHVETWRTTYHGLMPAELLAGLSTDQREVMWRATIDRASGDAGVAVLEAGDEVVGFCHHAPSRDADAPPATGEVVAIYVLATHSRSGGGSALMSWSIDSMSRLGLTRATLWVLDGNESADSFYEKRGWTRDGAEKRDQWGAHEIREHRYSRTLAGPGDARTSGSS